MKKRYTAPELIKIDIDTVDIMSLSNLLSTDSETTDTNGSFVDRDTFEWVW